ncbi:MAG TPA: HAD-IIIC family phosphatase [Candidatus Dormibacteraeota bacterium]|nr:HAD-IIIC family phosphatase [Candidatus Dormibacteraeota bacterium]
MSKALPQRQIRIRNGIYGNLAHNIQLAAEQNIPNVVIALEWFDFDPRLGIRSLGGWQPAQSQDILDTAAASAHRLNKAMAALPPSSAVALSLPTLPLPPVFQTHSTVLSFAESRLLSTVMELGSWAAGKSNMRVVHQDALAEISPMRERWDAKWDLASGFPYTVAHADALSSLMTAALVPAPRRKGIISDLDDTFWAGILGEIGVSGVSWTLEYGTQVHGLYQQLLASLAETGTLVAIASKNDPKMVEDALLREDLLARRKILFPIDAHWGAKSESVGRILEAWNVGAASAVFIDDSKLELAEVKSAFPEMECIQFPTKNPAGVLRLLKWLRDEFGRESAGEEDKLRRESLQQKEVFQTEFERADPEQFLKSLEATVTIAEAGRSDQRAFDLVNKTNQFNLNGARYTPDAWHERAGRKGDFVFTAAYEDRFGPLGKIAVMAGEARDGRIELEDWVISCRAFSRRIEFQCLRTLFESFGASEIAMHFKPTARNGATHDLLKIVFNRLPESGAILTLTRDLFEARCPRLYHEIREPRSGLRKSGGAARKLNYAVPTFDTAR